ncbi:MAG: crossover junction endodeoxyribonuclease RuvC [Puniceicoccales bacterium]|jgi:crossover junction endodeoxyribonuclease RuvC|nr:crossover junction endodeoxyribonuclease RuvC [Puniceicoccales bacterium]
MARKNSRALWAEKIPMLRGRPPAAVTGRFAARAGDVSGAEKPASVKASAEPAALDSRFGTRQPYKGHVLGIDPSLRGTGLAVVEFAPGGGGEPALRASRTLRLGRELSMPECLGEIYKAVADYIEDWPIRHVVLEQTIYVQNFQTAQILGSARGAAIAAASVLGKSVFEYPPLRVKQAVAGFGRASKSQIAGMIHRLLTLPESLPSDESDAAAVALCHAYTWRG